MTYYVCSDRIDGKENSYINAVIKELKAKGKDAVNAGVGPNKEAVRNSKTSKDTVVFIVGGGAAGCTLASFVKSAEGHDYAHTIFGYAGWCGNPYVTEARARTDKLVREHDCNFFRSWMPSYYEGHTIFTFCKKYSKYVSVCCSDKSAEDLGRKIANGKCGGTGDSDDKGSSASTIKDAIKEVLSEWDGEVECRVVNDTVYINKIPEPSTVKPILELTEGRNIVLDSVSITDVNPDTVNFLTVTWAGGDDIVLRDEELIARFGEKPLELEAVKRVEVSEDKKEEEDTSSTDTADDTTSTSDNKTKTEEVPVETYEEALHFANLEWAKTKRENGHTLECGVVGGPEWQQGKWVKVYIPSFEEDRFMYITKVSHSEDDHWDFKISLTDYPPGFGKPKKEEETDTDDEDSEETDTGEVDV